MKVRVCFHDKCFDGASSAAIFTRFYRERIHPDAEFLYRGMTHKASHPFEGGVFKLRRGFHLEPGARVAMVEDIVTTGLSSRECIAAIRAAGGDVVCAACIVDRSGGRADVGAPLVALASLDVPAYPADALPPELAAIPTEDPGSRRLSA